MIFASLLLGASVLPLVSTQDPPPEKSDPREFLHAGRFDLTDLQVSRELVLHGGPRKDGIPALTKPNIVKATDASELRNQDRVVGIEIGGQARAYPIRILNWHEIVNDTLGDEPIVVVYCPLCDSVTVSSRRLGDDTLEFGVSGLLLYSNVLMYERESDALWSQLGLKAISGPHVGQSMKHISFTITRWDEWKKAHADTTVLSFKQAFQRDYNRNPYEAYFKDLDQLYFPVQHEDHRLPRKTPVIGVRHGELTRAYPMATVAAAPGGRLVDEINGEVIELQASKDGRSVEIVSAPEEADIAHTFWYAWAAFHPETQLFKGATKADRPAAEPGSGGHHEGTSSGPVQ